MIDVLLPFLYGVCFMRSDPIEDDCVSKRIFGVHTAQKVAGVAKWQ